MALSGQPDNAEVAASDREMAAWRELPGSKWERVSDAELTDLISCLGDDLAELREVERECAPTPSSSSSSAAIAPAVPRPSKKRTIEQSEAGQ